ncbi:exodeoxyribonuclease VII large subunit [bacterium]|nr:exodeoxyribonuclease VII large subunit [bacterium]
MSPELFAESPGGSRRRILGVRELNESISAALKTAFPGTVWVKGEVQRLPADAARRSHVYFELHETGTSGAAEFQIPVGLMGWDRQRYGLGRYLDGTDPDFQLADRMEVCLEAQVDFYPPFGKLSLKVVGIDPTYSLGRLEARRREVLAYLTAEGLLEKQSALTLPRLPLRVGLITAAGSAAERDFITGLEASGRPFQITLRGAKMQGDQLEAEVSRALAAHARSGVDVIVITRGGGSRADLSWFDQKDLAVAIAGCPVPVITAIGHEIDRSIADLVAHHSCKTPTAAAEFLVDRIEEAADLVEEAAARLALRVASLLDQAAADLAVGDRLARLAHRIQLDASLRRQELAARLQDRVAGRLAGAAAGLGRLEARLSGTASGRLAARRAELTTLVPRLARAGNRPLSGASQDLSRLCVRLDRASEGVLGRRGKDLEHAAVKVRLMDPARLLARGYTLTLDREGRTLRSAGSLAPGRHILTRFPDGEVPSIVQAGDPAGSPRTPNRKGGKGGGKEADPGQESLFR